MRNGFVAALIGLVACAAMGPVLTGPAWAQKGAVLPGGNPKAPISIDAGKLDYFEKDARLTYSGGVVAKQGESTLRAQVLSIFLIKNAPAEGAPAAPAAAMGAGGASQMRRMEASGGVSITSKDQVGMGDQGVYDKIENKVYLTGNVSLSQGANITKGERLIYDLTTGQAQIESSTKGRVMSIFTPGSGEEDTRKPKTR